MLCFYVKLPTKHLTQDLLIDMLLDWINNTKNKMEGLNYDGRIPFEYEVNQKRLKIQLFEQQYLTLYFSTKDNYKKTHFIVEVIYDMLNEEIHLCFSKETSNESRYIPAISIPALFKTIMMSQYIDDAFPMNGKAHRITKRDQLQKIQTQIPLIYMRTKTIDANHLAREVLGLAHVCYCPQQKEDYSIEIIDENGSRFYQINKKASKHYQIREINELLRNTAIDKYKEDMPSYESLYQKWVYHQQHSAMKNSQEYQDEFREEIKRRQQELYEFKDMYHMLLEEIEDLRQKNEKLSQIHGCYSSSLLCINDMDKVSLYQKTLLQYLKHKTYDLESTHEIYRRLDILKAILEKNGGKL